MFTKMAAKASINSNEKKDEANSNSTDFLFGRWLACPPPGEEVVISGMSGRFPESNNIYEFRDNLFAKKDMVTDDGRRWKLDHPEIPQRSAKIYNIDKFDPGFFGLHYRQANMMDPMMRGIIQAAQEAIMDAGVNPSELEGSKTGVFVSITWSDSANDTLCGVTTPQMFGLTGYLKSLMARRISYHFKLKGPSYIIDTACSSSLFALDQAFKSMRSGECDNALVGTGNLLQHPGSTIQFFRLGVLSSGGKCRVFDEDADGYVRGETIACIFLQKAKNSRRIYGQVVATKVNSDGFKEQTITFPSTDLQQQLITEIYDESRIDPSDLSFLEAHGTGTQVGDPQEVEAIDCAIGKRRRTPLWIGSVKSSIGHTEPASGVCSIVKVIIAMETGLISPNINLNQIKKGMEGFEQGRLKAVTEITELEGDEAIVGINNFGFGGSNCHVVIRRFGKKKTIAEEGNIPALICVSGRTEDSVLTIFDDLDKRKVDAEYIGLFHQIFKKDIANHLYRGYTIISSNGTTKTSSQRITEQRPPLYIIFGKFENCFRFVGRNFLGFSVFKATMLRINKILSSENINIIDVLQENTEFTNDLLAIVSVQVGIVDTLKSLELEASVAYGNSFEKLICAYFNESITVEETILTALKIAKKTPKIISEMDFEKALLELKHTSTKRLGRYFFKGNNTRNLHEESLSYESLNNISKNSIVLNFSDKHLNRINLAFPGNYITTFLETMGSLYLHGYNPQLDKLYPEIIYPVSRGTPMISPLVKWNHQKSWDTYKFIEFKSKDNDHTYNLSFLFDEYKHIDGHVIDGRNLIPATEYLNLVWQAFAQCRTLLKTDLPVVFENCKFIRALTMPKTGFLKLFVSIQKGTGNFEVLEKNSLVVSGQIYAPPEIKNHQTDLPPFVLNDEHPTNILEQDEIYRELYLRGYNYGRLFKGVVKCNVESSTALVRWENNWTTFMDKMLQIKILQIDTRFLYVPIGIKKLTIDPFKHARILQNFNGEECLLPVHMYKENNIIKSAGIEICGVQASKISRRKPPLEPVLEKYEFVPNDAFLNLTQSTRVNTQIILENSLENSFKAVEIIDKFTKSGGESLLALINKALEDIPLVNPDLIVSTKTVLEEIAGVKIEEFVLTPTSNLLLIVGTKILQRAAALKQFLIALSINGFVLTREENNFIPGVIEGIEILTEHIIEDEKLILFRRSEQIKSTHCIEISSQDFKWLPELQTALKREQNVLVYSQNQESDGIMGFLNCIRREPGGDKVRGFLMIDEVPKFDPQEAFYKDQIKKDLAVNIYRNSKWGTNRHLVLDEIPEVESEYCFANVAVDGNLSSFKWVEGPLSFLKLDQTLIHTYYAAVNFKDIMLASGRIGVDVITSNRIEQECLLGFEFSGRDPRGNRITAITTGRALSTFSTADVYLQWPVPETWSLEDAATVPAVYVTVVYALLMVTNLEPGVSILIHSATGGIGIAALNVALYHGCDVFVTVGAQEKRDFLKDQYPQIPESHIGNSHDTSFEEMIKSETKGRGVDIVLNSLTGDKLRASINCLACGGKFMDIGKFDLANDTSLKLMSMEKEITYYGVMLDQIFEKSPQVKLKLSKMVSDGIRLGFIKPLPRTVFGQNEVEMAFRYMTTGKHIGKVLLKIRNEENRKVVVPSKTLLKGMPRFYCNSDKSYIIIGGLGGIGLELADWLVLRRAKKLILVSRSGIQTGYPTQRIGHWKKYGVTVHISKSDVTTKQGCLDLIKESNQLGAIDGVFNLAAVLKDALFEDQTEEKFRISLAPKAHVTTILDQVTREHCPGLRYFVIFSSVSCGRGNAGQTNYGMGNSVMERICEKRKRDGLPALAIQWGAIGDVGLVAKMQKENKELVIGGTLQQKIASCLEVLDRFLKQDNPIVSSMVVAEKRSRSDGLISAVDAVAQILGIKDIKTVSPHSTLAELGMDSMMGTEVMQILEKDFEIYITSSEIRSLTFAKLIEIEAENKSNAKNKIVNKTERGTNMLLQYIPDRNTSDLSVVKLPSLVNDDEEAATVYLLPGLEGVFLPFEPLTKNLKVHVLGLQYSYNSPEDTIQQVAETILPHIEANISKEQTFHVICYSFGVLVALEIATLLEAKGITGKIIAIDGAPAYLSASLKERVPCENQAEFETLLLCQIAALLLPFDVIAKSKDTILNCVTFDDRINIVKSLLPQNVPNREALDNQGVHMIYKRLKAILKYDFIHNKIKSSLRLFKAKYPLMANTENDYKLSELCEKPIKVTILDADHITILKQTELAEAVKKLIELA